MLVLLQTGHISKCFCTGKSSQSLRLLSFGKQRWYIEVVVCCALCVTSGALQTRCPRLVGPDLDGFTKTNICLHRGKNVTGFGFLSTQPDRTPMRWSLIICTWTWTASSIHVPTQKTSKTPPAADGSVTPSARFQCLYSRYSASGLSINRTEGEKLPMTVALCSPAKFKQKKYLKNNDKTNWGHIREFEIEGEF